MKNNELLDYIRELYPDAIIEYQFSSGEVIFYKNPGAEDRMAPSSCYRCHGQIIITDDF